MKTASPRGLVGSNPTPAASFTPNADALAGARLGQTLRRLGYVEETLLELFASDDYPANAVDVYVFARRLPDTKLGTAVPRPRVARAVERRRGAVDDLDLPRAVDRIVRENRQRLIRRRGDPKPNSEKVSCAHRR